MPIRPENRNRYPKDWPVISKRIRDRANNKCEWCGVQNGALGARSRDGTFLPAQPLGEMISGLQWPQPGQWGWCGPASRQEYLRIIRVVLTTAHLDHQPENCADANLSALCQQCHNRYDAPMRRAGIRQRRRNEMAIRELL